MAVLWAQGCQLRNDTAPLGVVSLELANDATEAAAVIRSWADRKTAAIWQVWLDFPFIFAYAAALFYWGRVAARAAADWGLSRLAKAAKAAAIGGIVAGVLDIFEDACLLAMLYGVPTDGLAAWGSCLAAIKFVLIAASFAVPVVAALSRPVTERPEVSWSSLLRATRPVLGVLIFTAVALLLPPQTADMLASLSVFGLRGIWSAVIFHVSLIALALSSWFWSRALLSAQFGPSDTQADRERIVEQYGGNLVPLNWLPRVLFIAAAAIGIIAAARSSAWTQLVIIAVWTFVGTALLYHRLQPAPGDAPPPTAAPEQAEAASEMGLRPLLRGAPSRPWIGRYVLWAAILVFAAGAIGSLFPEMLGFLGVATSELGYVFPGPSAALIGLALLLAPLAAITAVTDQIRFMMRVGGVPWPVHPPVFLALLIAVLVVPSLINLHAVRLAPTAAATAVKDRKSLDELFKAWAVKCQPSGPVQPVIVAVSGGASRAGLWAARVLAEADAVAEAGKTGIFAVSSVSGGSLGAAAYVATMAGQDGCTLNAGNRERFAKSVVASLGDDALGPLLAGSLFGDIPRALLAIPAHLFRRGYYALGGNPVEDWRGGDRADSLETAFERIWRGAAQTSEAGGAPLQFSEPFLNLASAPGRLLWIANGTNAQNGTRVLTAPFPVGQWPFLGAQDALQLLGRDVPISTAIHNTARFPFLSPAGELSPVRAPPAGEASTGGPVQLIDGGYFENEGLLTAWELARYLEANAATLVPGRAVQPILIQATADAEKDISESRIVRCGDATPPAPPAAQAPVVEPPAQSMAKSRPLQAAIPLLGLYSVRGGHSDWVLRQVRDEYCKKGSAAGTQRFHHYYLYRIGEDVPLNWTLSPRISCRIWRAVSEPLDDKRDNPNLDQSVKFAGLLHEAKAPGPATADAAGDLCKAPPRVN